MQLPRVFSLYLMPGPLRKDLEALEQAAGIFASIWVGNAQHHRLEIYEVFAKSGLILNMLPQLWLPRRDPGSVQQNHQHWDW